MIIAIDPGASGGIAWYESLDIGNKPCAIKMTDTIGDLKTALQNLRPVKMVFLENVRGAMPGNGVASAAKFAEHIGEIKGLLCGLDIPMDKVSPQTWQKYLGVPADLHGKENSRARKNWIKARMQERYPNLKITLATSDALGILTWALQKNQK